MWGFSCLYPAGFGLLVINWVTQGRENWSLRISHCVCTLRLAQSLLRKITVSREVSSSLIAQISHKLHSRVCSAQTLQNKVILQKLNGTFLLMWRPIRSSLLWSALAWASFMPSACATGNTAIISPHPADRSLDQEPSLAFLSFCPSWHLQLELNFFSPSQNWELITVTTFLWMAIRELTVKRTVTRDSRTC